MERGCFLGKLILNSDSLGKSTSVPDMVNALASSKTTAKLMSESEECYWNLFNSKDLVVIVCDVESMLIEGVNEAAQDLYGYSKAEFRKLMPLDFSTGRTEVELAMTGMKTSQAVHKQIRHCKQIKKEALQEVVWVKSKNQLYLLDERQAFIPTDTWH